MLLALWVAWLLLTFGSIVLNDLNGVVVHAHDSLLPRGEVKPVNGWKLVVEWRGYSSV